MSARQVAHVVALVFLAVGREVPEGVPDAWFHVLGDVDDGPDVAEVALRLVRGNLSGFALTAAQVRAAVLEHRQTEARRAEVAALIEATRRREELAALGLDEHRRALPPARSDPPAWLRPRRRSRPTQPASPRRRYDQTYFESQPPAPAPDQPEAG